MSMSVNKNKSGTDHDIIADNHRFQPRIARQPYWVMRFGNTVIL